MDGGPPVADPHLHTTVSDGRLTINALPDATRTGGVGVVVVTDHDRYHPELDVLVVERDGVTVVRGIELHVDVGDHRVDLLGYGFREQPVLVETAEQLQQGRVERAYEIIAAIEEETGICLEIDIHDSTDRPHVARAIGVSEASYNYQGMLNELTGADGPCYVARKLPTFSDGVVALRDACDVVGPTHPFRYRNPAGALEFCADLNAVEHYYPYGFDAEVDLVEEAVERYGLLATGGGDAHNEIFGRAGSSEANFARFTAAVGGL